MMNKTNGFTLIEVIIATVIIGVLVVGAVAGFTLNNERQRVRQAAESLVTDLRSVQKRADAGEVPETCDGKLVYYRVVANTSSVTVDVNCQDSGSDELLEFFVKNGASITSGGTFDFYPLGRGTSIAQGVVLKFVVLGADLTTQANVNIDKGGSIWID